MCSKPSLRTDVVKDNDMMSRELVELFAFHKRGFFFFCGASPSLKLLPTGTVPSQAAGADIAFPSWTWQSLNLQVGLAKTGCATSA